METKQPRMAVYPSDLEKITGQSLRTCQRLFNKIRDLFGLEPRQVVTVYHASEYLGVPVQEMSRYIR